VFWGYPQLILRFSTDFSTFLWITVDKLWTNVDMCCISLIFPCIAEKSLFLPKDTSFAQTAVFHMIDRALPRAGEIADVRAGHKCLHAVDALDQLSPP